MGPTPDTVAIRPQRKLSPVATSSVAALKRDAFVRNRIHVRNVAVLLVVGAAFLPLLDGDPLATKLVLASLTITTLAYGWILWATRDPERYDERAAAVVAHIAAATSVTTIYYFGVFSAAPALMVSSMFVYALGAKLRHSLGVFLVLAVGQMALAGLIIAGVIQDRGLVRADYLSTREQIVLQLFLGSLYVVTFMGARAGRRSTASAMRELEAAVRQIAQREALLQEARQELEAALRVGGPGRYTGQRVGSFQLGVLLGRGGMGEVYEATHATTGDGAAVKLMPPASLAHRDYIERFIREIRAVAAIDAPNIVRVLEVAPEDAAFPYLAMERLDGHSLSEILRERGRLPLPECVDLATQVARGLEAARAAGIVHRDLKPGNLFLHGGATWKILDFGVSKLADHSGTLTRGQAVGTPAFMAPEQARGEDVDHRADQYALAVNVYRALTGQPAFNGADVPSVMYAVVHNYPPPPSQFVDVSKAVDRAMARALAKRRDNRFESAVEFAEALAAAAATRGR